jgi:hypothetical protein
MGRMPYLIAGSLLVLIAGCSRDDQIQTYRVSKEAGSSPSMPLAAPAPRRQEISWKVPKGWVEQAPSAMRVGSFRINGTNGQTADVSIIPLSGMAGGNLANINRWRGQINLDPLSEDTLSQQSQTITPGGRTMLLVDFTNQGKRLVAAIYTQGERTWFFKMLGDEVTVKSSKPAFLQFLQDLRFHGQ